MLNARQHSIQLMLDADTKYRAASAVNTEQHSIQLMLDADTKY